MTEYEHDDYAKLIEEFTRDPMAPSTGLPLFGGLFAAALVAKAFLGPTFSGLALFLLLLVFPWYAVRLLMRWRMRRHLDFALQYEVKPSYVPSSWRAWVGVYMAVFLVSAYVVMWIDGLSAR